MHFLDTYLAMATRFQCPALEKTWSPTFEMRWLKKKKSGPYKFAMTVFTLSLCVSSSFCRLSAFHNQADLKRFTHVGSMSIELCIYSRFFVSDILTLAATALLGANLLPHYGKTLRQEPYFCLWVWTVEHRGILRIWFPSGRISMAEWVGDGVWSWFSDWFCYRFSYRFVLRRFSQSVVRGTYLICSSYKC